MDTLNISGLSQPGVNLGGLLTNSGMSGSPGTMSGGTQGTQGGGGMAGGLDLAELLQMLGQGEGDTGGAPGALGSLPFSFSQAQQGGLGAGQLGQDYLTAGGGASAGTISQMGAVSPTTDPLAMAQKILGLASKGASATGLSQQSLLPSPSIGTDFDPTGQTQTEGFQSYRAGERGDFSTLGGVSDFLNQPLTNLQGQLTPAEMAYIQSQNPMTGGQAELDLQDFRNQGAQDMPDLSGGGGASLSGSGAGPSFNPTIGNALGLLSGGLGLYSGIQNENPYGIAGGSIGTAGSLASMAGMPATGAAIGSLGGPLSLAAGVQSKDPISLATGLYQTYNTLATLSQMFPSLAQSLFGTTLPTGGQLAGQALAYVAPDLAASLGVGGAAAGTGGLAAAEAAGASAPAIADAAMGGTVAGLGTGAATGAGLAAGVVSYAALPVAIALGMWQAEEANQMKELMNKTKESYGMQRDMPARLGRIGDAFRAANSTANIPALPTDQLYGNLEKMMQAWQQDQVELNKFVTAKGSEAPSRVKRVNTEEYEAVQRAMQGNLPPAIAATVDELAKRGVPVEQFWNPGGFNDILALAGGNYASEDLANVGPGNMAEAVRRIRSGESLQGIAAPLVDAGALRRAAFSDPSKRATAGTELDRYNNQYSHLDPYFFTPDERAQMQEYQNILEAHPGPEEFGTTTVGKALGMADPREALMAKYGFAPESANYLDPTLGPAIQQASATNDTTYPLMQYGSGEVPWNGREAMPSGYPESVWRTARPNGMFPAWTPPGGGMPGGLFGGMDMGQPFGQPEVPMGPSLNPLTMPTTWPGQAGGMGSPMMAPAGYSPASIEELIRLMGQRGLATPLANPAVQSLNQWY